MSTTHPQPTADTQEGVRLDIWLWRARFFKSRTLSATAIKKGRIRLVRFGKTTRIKKPHFLVLPHDQLVFMRSEILEQIEVVKLGIRRGPAKEAQTLYHHISETKDR